MIKHSDVSYDKGEMLHLLPFVHVFVDDVIL